MIKISRLKKVIRNIFILTFLSVVLFKQSGLYLTPLAAHKHSERSAHYGPSEVVHIEDFDKGKYILAKYDQWASCSTVHRTPLFLWRIGGLQIGIERDQTKAVNYSWGGGSGQYYYFYGIINDDQVKKIQITLNDGKILTQTNFYEHLFLITAKKNDNKSRIFKSIKGYDSEHNLIFEDEY